jgi:hypothetical protein
MAIETRLRAVEHMILHNGRPDEKIIEEQSAKDRKFGKAELAQRWGKSPRSIDRDRSLPGFPVPEVENGRLRWWLSKIQAYERRRFEEQLEKQGRGPDRSTNLPRKQERAAVNEKA